MVVPQGWVSVIELSMENPLKSLTGLKHLEVDPGDVPFMGKVLPVIVN